MILANILLEIHSLKQPKIASNQNKRRFLHQSNSIDNKTKLCFYFYIYSLKHASLIILSLAKMLNQEESLVLDEGYRQMVEEDVPTGGLVHFEEAMAVLTSHKADIQNQHRAAILMRKYLQTPFSKMSVAFGKKIILRLIEYSHQQQYPQIRYQALRILVNMSIYKVNHCQLSDFGALKLFFSLIHHDNVAISRLAIWGIANIAAGIYCSDIGQDNLKLLLELQKTSKDEKTNELLLWALAHLLVFFRDTADNEALTALLPVYNNFAPQYVSEVWVYTMSYYFRKEKIRALFESGTVSQLFNYLQSKNKKLVYQSLGLISMIIHGGNQYIDRLIEFDLIGHMARLLENQSPHYFRITCLLSSLSKLANNSCKRLLAESDVILGELLALPNKEPDNFTLKLELGRFISNIFPFANPQRLYSFCKQSDFVRIYLDESEPRFITSLIQSLPEVLELGKKFKQSGKNVFVEKLCQEGAVERWQYLLQSEDEQLASQLLIIFDKYIYP